MSGINIKKDNAEEHIHDMLKEYLKLDDDEMTKMFTELLNKDQLRAFNLFKLGKNLSIVGVAGSGKSYLIKTINAFTKNILKKRIYVCSTTGISAYNIGGMTINAFMGIGTGESNLETLIRRVYKNKSICDRIYYTDTLIIDEISMMSASLFEKINLLCQKIKRNKRFFGGIQLIITGDHHQLLPIFKSSFGNNEEKIDTRLIVESEVFLSNFTKENTVLLKENVRQKNDNELIELLLNIRYNNLSDDDIALLKKKVGKVHDDKEKAIVTVVTTNKKAQMINEDNLSKVKEPERVFNTSYELVNTGVTVAKEETKKILRNELENQFTQKGINKITLKKGVPVMLIKNLDVDIGLVNGILGIVVNFVGGFPEVLFNNKIKKVISYTEWELEMDNCKIVAQQIPLMLSYALTIHKLQGTTLDEAILDLADCFCDHQVYVAMSRVRTLEGIYLKSFNHKKITINKKIMEYMDKLLLEQQE